MLLRYTVNRRLGGTFFRGIEISKNTECAIASKRTFVASTGTSSSATDNTRVVTQRQRHVPNAKPLLFFFIHADSRYCTLFHEFRNCDLLLQSSRVVQKRQVCRTHSFCRSEAFVVCAISFDEWDFKFLLQHFSFIQDAFWFFSNYVFVARSKQRKTRMHFFFWPLAS